MAAAGSVLSPGLPTLDAASNVVFRAGVMTLGANVTANNGGTFDFYVDDNDGNIILVNSRIDITGGTITLGGTKTVNLYGLGAGLIQTGVAYTLINVSDAGSLTAGWEDGWVVGANTTGYAVQSFGWDGDLLQVTLIPEPGTMMLLLSGLTALLVVRRRRG